MSFVRSKSVGTAAVVLCPDPLTVPDGYRSPVHTDPASGGTWIGGWTNVAASGIAFNQGAAHPAFTVNYAAYRQLGDDIKWQGLITFTGAGAALGNIGLSTPGPYTTNIRGSGVIRPVGTCIIFATSANAYYKGLAAPIFVNTFEFLATSTTSPNYLGAVDFTAALAPGDTFAWDIEYQVAG